MSLDYALAVWAVSHRPVCCFAPELQIGEQVMNEGKGRYATTH